METKNCFFFFLLKVDCSGRLTIYSFFFKMVNLRAIAFLWNFAELRFRLFWLGERLLVCLWERDNQIIKSLPFKRCLLNHRVGHRSFSAISQIEMVLVSSLYI